jgi:hypothetical protein
MQEYPSLNLSLASPSVPNFMGAKLLGFILSHHLPPTMSSSIAVPEIIICAASQGKIDVLSDALVKLNNVNGIQS